MEGKSFVELAVKRHKQECYFVGAVACLEHSQLLIMQALYWLLTQCCF